MVKKEKKHSIKKRTTCKNITEEGFTQLELVVAMVLLSTVLLVGLLFYESSLRAQDNAEASLNFSIDAQNFSNNFQKDVHDAVYVNAVSPTRLDLQSNTPTMCISYEVKSGTLLKRTSSSAITEIDQSNSQIVLTGVITNDTDGEVFKNSPGFHREGVEYSMSLGREASDLAVTGAVYSRNSPRDPSTVRCITP